MTNISPKYSVGDVITCYYKNLYKRNGTIIKITEDSYDIKFDEIFYSKYDNYEKEKITGIHQGLYSIHTIDSVKEPFQIIELYKPLEIKLIESDPEYEGMFI